VEGKVLPAFNRALYGHGLWGSLLEHHVHCGSADGQAKALASVERARANGDEEALMNLAVNAKTLQGLRELPDLKGNAGWEAAMAGFLDALAFSLRRELAARRPVPIPQDARQRVLRTIRGLGMYAETDVLNVYWARPPDFLTADYISVPRSPEYDGADGPWGRDTEFQFEFNFGAGLFIWLSAHVVKEFRSQGLAGQYMRAAEQLAVDFGFRRFCVGGPVLEAFWTEAMGYGVAPEHQVGQSDHPRPRFLEGYKEVP
jgi:GNAT superfamily N-acetyltransferase